MDTGGRLPENRRPEHVPTPRYVRWLYGRPEFGPKSISVRFGLYLSRASAGFQGNYNLKMGTLLFFTFKNIYNSFRCFCTIQQRRPVWDLNISESLWTRRSLSRLSRTWWPPHRSCGATIHTDDSASSHPSDICPFSKVTRNKTVKSSVWRIIRWRSADVWLTTCLVGNKNYEFNIQLMTQFKMLQMKKVRRFVGLPTIAACSLRKVSSFNWSAPFSMGISVFRSTTWRGGGRWPFWPAQRLWLPASLHFFGLQCGILPGGLQLDEAVSSVSSESQWRSRVESFGLSYMWLKIVFFKF